MIPPNQNRSCRVILSVAMIFSLVACAGYPGGPRSPQPGDDSYTVEEDTLLNIPYGEGILINDQAREGTDLVLLTSGEMDTQAGGIVNMDPRGGFTYEPPANFSGSDQVAYTIRNQKGKTSEGMIFFEVAPVNDPPEPSDDYARTLEDVPVEIPVLDNDTDPDGDAMLVVTVGTPDSGSVRINSDGTLLYTPPANHSGDITFSYTVSDGNGETSSATVFVNIENVDAGIEVLPDSFPAMEDQSLTIAVDDLLENDQDLETGGPLSVVALGNVVEPGVDEDERGSLNLIGNAAIIYTPAADFSGNATFTYTVQSQNGGTASGTVTVEVAAVPDPPVISDIVDIEIAQGDDTGAIEFTISDVDTDLAELNLTAVVTDSDPPALIPAEGISIGSGTTATRTIIVRPDPNLSGTATITVTVRDRENQTSDAFVLTVTPANTAPNITPIDDQTTRPNIPVTVNFSVDDDQTPLPELTVSAASDNAALVPAGNFEYSGAGRNRSITITPTGQEGSTTITVSVSDGSLTSRVSFRLAISSPVNTSPTISAIGNRSIVQNESVDVPFTIGDNESDPAELSLSVESSDSTVVPNTAANLLLGGSGADRTLTVTSIDQSGTTTITITVSDGNSTAQSGFQLEVTADASADDSGDAGTSTLLYISSAASLSSNVATVDAGPLVEDDIYSTSVDRTLTVSVDSGLLANDRTVELQTLRATPINRQNLILNTDGGFTYSPPVGFAGRQTFDYSVSDGTLTVDATVTFVVGGNQVPQAGKDSYTATSDSRPIGVTSAEGLLANDIDPDGDALFVVSTGVFDTQYGGEVNIGPEGEFSYLSPPLYEGVDSFVYTVSDGRDSANGIAVISVTP